MRPVIAIATLVGVAAWSVDPGQRVRDPEADYHLTRAEVARYMAPYYPGVRACYFENVDGVRTATGRLTLHATVLGGGDVIGLVVDAPGVTGARLRGLEECLQKEVDEWHFPLRRYDTPVELPYYFQRSYLPGIGPHYTCWNPRGCLDRRYSRSR